MENNVISLSLPIIKSYDFNAFLPILHMFWLNNNSSMILFNAV